MKDPEQIEEFNKTSPKIENANFRHHNPETCVCEDCNCGRHLCKLHIVKPDMSKGSIYRKDFDKKRTISNEIPKREE